MEIVTNLILLKSIAMTNKEILQADLLDILFENRNKAYGAYALRKDYNNRLQWALGISLSLAALLLFMNSKKENTLDNGPGKPDGIIHSYAAQKDKTEQPQQRKQKTETHVRQVRSTSNVQIVPNNVKPDVPDQKDLNDAVPSDETTNGTSATDVVQSNVNSNGNGSGEKEEDGPKEKQIIVSQSDAQFPGGRDAFAKFLTRNLITPDELEAGEKKIVLVRFKVDVDGTISKTEIIQTGGDNYTREVLRVLAKMPKWIPAMQNGNKVATWFVQAVTFIGLEQ
jgi:protein TonB